MTELLLKVLDKVHYELPKVRMKLLWSFPLRIYSVMWPNPQESAALVTSTEDILNGKLHYLCKAWQIFAGRKMIHLVAHCILQNTKYLCEIFLNLHND